MRQHLMALVSGLGIIFAATALLAKSAKSEILVASSAILKPEWTELRPKTTIKTSGSWSELFIEIPGLHTERAGGPLLVEDKELSVEGYLIAKTGERIGLDQV